ncbi:helix-turn-helix transcriptional regulator [Saccharicrinis aurantiacus]|uniref:helix-turn-helix transcriptional regulator n=1 Tax=Saccharicrinis aurantiacus TaxID=1849719 RepID=UPI0024923163|nr:AraC family transcriptional regulator [Saccharicrinis aurantiacus]
MKSIDLLGYNNSGLIKSIKSELLANDEDGFIRINNSIIEGTISHYSLANLLHIRVNNIHIKETFKVNFHPDKDMISCYFFYDIQTNQPLLISNEPINHDILCVKNNTPLCYTLPKNTTAKSILIAISKDFYDDQSLIKNTIIEKLFALEDLCLFQMETPQIMALCRKLFDVQKSKALRNYLSIGTSIELLGYFFELLDKRDNNIPTSTLKEHNFQKVMKARTLLLHDLKNPPMIEDLAIKVSSSSSQLRKHFKELFGQSIYQYYKIYKLEMSYMWLQGGISTIKEAAIRTGYSSYSKFSAEFKKHHGISPSAIQIL